MDRNFFTGEFHYTKVLDGLVAKESFDKLRKIMYDLCHASHPVIEPVGSRDGIYRHIQPMPAPLVWEDVQERKEFPLLLPFDLRKYVFIYPNTVIIVAGAKRAGKTAFLF